MLADATYPVIAEPPSEPGAANENVTTPSPALKDVILGALGATAAIVNVTSCVPVAYVAVDAAVARTVHVPGVEKLRTPVDDDTEQFEVVPDPATTE